MKFIYNIAFRVFDFYFRNIRLAKWDADWKLELENMSPERRAEYEAFNTTKE